MRKLYHITDLAVCRTSQQKWPPVERKAAPEVAPALIIFYCNIDARGGGSLRRMIGFELSIHAVRNGPWKESGMRKQAPLVLMLALLLLTACGQPVPQDKAAYVGEWRGQSMSLTLRQDGRVLYKRVKGSTTTSIDGPLRRFEGDNFVVGIPFIETTFEVSKPPYEEAGTWKMVVDGVEVTRTP